MAPQNVRGVQVDNDARRMNEPVTVVVWPSGTRQDADTWSDANNYRSQGAAIAEGYPEKPEMVLNPDLDPAPGNEPPEQSSRPAPAAQPARPAQPAPAPSA